MSNPASAEIEDEISVARGEIDSMIRSSLIKWCIRSTIGAILFGYLAYSYSWGIWILLLWIPFAALSLLAIVKGRATLEKQLRSLEHSAHELDAETEVL